MTDIQVISGTIIIIALFALAAFRNWLEMR